MILIRIILIAFIIYLLVRYLIESLNGREPDKPVNESEKNNPVRNKRISKEIGEYVDYEEIKKEKKHSS